MLVEDLAITPCEMPLEDKDWKFALGSVSAARGYVVAIRTGGHSGYGYAPAIPHMGSTFEMLPKELERFKPVVLGKDAFAIEAILVELDALLVGAHQAKGAIDCALHDLKARALGVPLYNLLGGKIRDKVPVLRILSLKTPDETAAIASKLFDQGYRYFKIKVHGDVEEDVARVKAIRARSGARLISPSMPISPTRRKPRSTRSTAWPNSDSIWSSSPCPATISKVSNSSRDRFRLSSKPMRVRGRSMRS